MAPLGLVETNAGVRSCMIEYEQRQMTLPVLLETIQKADTAIGNVKVCPYSRIETWH
jgi:allophanate hydrolase subunit 1